MNPHNVVRDFEKEVARYTGAPYCVAVNSCSAALMLAVAYYVQRERWLAMEADRLAYWERPEVEIPNRTYLSIPMSIIHAGGRPRFRDEKWLGAYQLKPLPVWDCARWFTSGLYRGHMTAVNDYGAIERNCAGQMLCTSHHWSKTLGIQQGGCILHDNLEADAWLRRARFDGRTDGVAPKDDRITQVGWHVYLSPSVAADGLIRLHHLPKHNEPLPNDDYPDLSKLAIFR